MSVEAQLEKACEQWQELASAEKDAIRENDWRRLAGCQEAIEALQPRLTEYLNQARAEWGHLGPRGEAPQARFRVRMGRLSELERENSALLEQTMKTAQSNLGELQQATHRLRRVRQSYTTPQPPGWTSFS